MAQPCINMTPKTVSEGGPCLFYIKRLTPSILNMTCFEMSICSVRDNKTFLDEEAAELDGLVTSLDKTNAVSSKMVRTDGTLGSTERTRLFVLTLEWLLQ